MTKGLQTRSGGVAWAWRVPALIGLVMLADLVTSTGVRQVQRMQSESEMVEAELTQEPYHGAEWGRAYWEELARYEENWEPYFVYRVGTMRGRFINVVDGVRRTYQSRATPGSRRPVVFIFGGSAAWGHGVRDEGTLPSLFARVAENQGEALDVRNYAESGWVNWQGIAYLLQRLSDGERPDVVIFYSGVNEMLSGRQWPALRRPIWDGDLYPQAMTELVEQRHRPLTRAWHFYRNTSFTLSALFGESGANAGPVSSIDALVPKIAGEYESDKAVVESLGRAYGFSSLFVWQLTVADKKLLSAQDRTYAGWLSQSPDSASAHAQWSLPGDLRDAYNAVGAEVIRQGTIDLSAAFDGMSDTAFIDWMHPTELGNEYIARALYKDVAPLLKESHDARFQ